MKTIILSISLTLMVNFLSAQELSKDTLNKKEIIERKKEEKAAIEQMLFENNYQKIVDKAFVIEANSILNKNGHTYNVNSKLNFFMVDSANSLLQVGSDFSNADNGVGGLTVQGKIIKYEVSKNDKHKTIYIALDIKSFSEYYHVTINISASGFADASISDTKYGQIVYYGNLVSLKDSKVYAGSRIINKGYYPIPH